MKRIQNFYLYSYRLIGFIFLVGLITSILWYGFSVLFFISNSSWSVPFIISSNQENVLIHQERLLNMEHDVLENDLELATAIDQVKSKELILKNAEAVYQRIEESMQNQSSRDEKISKIFKKLAKEKTQSVNELSNILASLQNREKSIGQELRLGLITSQEALTQRLALSNLRSNLIDAKAKVEELKQRTHDFYTEASTLNGSAMDLETMQKLVKKFDLSHQILQLKSDLYSLEISITHLKQNIIKKKKVLAIIKHSPYILATKKPVHVAFVPYANLPKAKIGTPVYSCYLDLLFCYKSGVVKEIFSAEEYGKHPIFKSDIKGQYIGIQFANASDAQKKLLFLNSKPLLI